MERQIGSTRRVCLDWILILNRPHLERVLSTWFEHYRWTPTAIIGALLALGGMAGALSRPRSVVAGPDAA